MRSKDRGIEGSWDRRIVVLFPRNPPFLFTRKTWFIDRRSVVVCLSSSASPPSSSRSLQFHWSTAEPRPRRFPSASQFYGKRKRGAFDPSRGAEDRSAARGGDRNGTPIICRCPPRNLARVHRAWRVSWTFATWTRCRRGRDKDYPSSGWRRDGVTKRMWIAHGIEVNALIKRSRTWLWGGRRGCPLLPYSSCARKVIINPGIRGDRMENGRAKVDEQRSRDRRDWAERLNRPI